VTVEHVMNTLFWTILRRGRSDTYREAMSALTHFIGTILALAGAIWMILLTRDDIPKLVTVTVFGTCMILVYLASTTMHFFASLKGSKHRLVRFFNRLDHAAIYLMIAGSYTPLAYSLLLDQWRWIMLGTVWLIAFTGVIVKLFFFFGGYLSTALYVGMGWLGVVAAPQAISVAEPNILWLIAAGGLSYMIGAAVFTLKRPNLHIHFGHHELWHLFVMGGTACHFAAVVWYII
jgi:hemolysin III